MWRRQLAVGLLEFAQTLELCSFETITFALYARPRTPGVASEGPCLHCKRPAEEALASLLRHALVIISTIN